MIDNQTIERNATDDLIRALSAQAGKGSRRTLHLSVVLFTALVLSVLAAISVVGMVTGPRSDLTQISSTWIFLFKVTSMVLVAAGGFHLVGTAVRPGQALRLGPCLAPALVFLLVGALLDRSELPLLGVHTYSFANCVGMIVMASIPALAAILKAMRAGTPTQLTRAGAVAGLLAGSVGGLAYTIACLNDGTAFVALWYSLSIAFVTALGASIGRTVLRW